MNVTLAIVELVLEEPWCIGAPEAADGDHHLPCARDPFGRINVPASSVAGSIRAYLSGSTDLDVEAVMGSAPRSEELAPSALRILGTEVRLPNDTKSTIRTQTAIDPRTGAARAHTLRTTENAPAGTHLDIFLRIDGSPSWEHELFDALTEWTPFIGRSRTSGMGAARVVAVRHGTLDLTTSHGLASWISSGGPALVRSVATADEHVPAARSARPVLDEPLVFTARDAIFSSGVSKGNSTTSHQRDGHYVLEGSSIKGVVRSRAGYVARTVGAVSCVDLTGCDDPACVVCELFGSTTRRGLLRVRAAELSPARVEGARHHVSIDRFTGGARDGQLFTHADVPIGARFELRIDTLGTAIPPWSTALLAAVMLDIHDGYVGFGGGTTRGAGTAFLPPETADALRDLLRATDLPSLLVEHSATNGKDRRV